jgi:Zn-dependent protease with chaperone function
LGYSSHDAGGAVEARGQVFFDGAGAPRRVDLRLGDTLQIFEAGAFRAAWALADIRRVERVAKKWMPVFRATRALNSEKRSASPHLSDSAQMRADPGGGQGPLRIRALTASPKAWCEISDPAFAAAVAQRCRLLDGDSQEKREALWRVAALATTGLVVIAALVWFVIPAIADRFAPLVPAGIEARIGAAADAEARARFKGGVCTSPSGEAALARLVDRVKVAAGVALDIRVGVLSSSVQNAFALPGGRIYLLRGLIEAAQSPDEVAGVLAHEMGHAAHRDGLRAALREGGVALTIGLVAGGAFGAGAIAGAARASLSAAYSREAETQADDFAAQALTRAGRPARALGDILQRIARGEGTTPLDFLRDHPLTDERRARLENESAQATGEALLSAGDWLALRAICGR